MNTNIFAPDRALPLAHHEDEMPPSTRSSTSRHLMDRARIPINIPKPGPCAASIPTEASTRRPQRGDIWFVGSRSMDKHKGTHWSVGTELWSNTFAVVISNDRMNATSGFVQIVYLSTSPRRKPTSLHIPVEIPAAPEAAGANSTGPGCNSVAFCEQVHSVDLSRMYEYHGSVPEKQMLEIERAVLWSLGIRDQHDPGAIQNRPERADKAV